MRLISLSSLRLSAISLPRADATHQFAHSALVPCACAHGLLVWAATGGTGPLSIMVAAFALSGVLLTTRWFPKVSGRSRIAALLIGVLAATAAAPYACESAFRSGIAATTDPGQFGLALCCLAGVLPCIVPFMLALATAPRTAQPSNPGYEFLPLIGCSVGIAWTFAVTASALPLMLITAVPCVAVLLCAVRRPETGSNPTVQKPESECEPDNAESNGLRARSCSAFAAGLIAAGAAQVLSAFMPMHPLMLLCSAGVCCVAMGIVQKLRARWPSSGAPIAVAAVVFITTLFALPHFWLERRLGLVASGTASGMLIIMDSLFAGLVCCSCILPASFRRTAEPAVGSGSCQASSRFPVQHWIFLCGFGSAYGLLIPMSSPTVVAAAGILLTGASRLIGISSSHRTQCDDKSPRSADRSPEQTRSLLERIRRRILAPAATASVAGLVCAACIVAFAGGDPDRVAGLAFQGNVLQGVRAGMDSDQIRQAVNTRLLEACNTVSGRLTIWRGRGESLIWRLNGFPVSVTSLDSQTTPGSPAETLAAVLPLTAHPAARTCMILGDYSGGVAEVCSGFPLHTITVCRPERSAPDDSTLLSQPGLGDSRLKRVRVPASVGVRQGHLGRFDVVISSGPNPVDHTGLCQLTSGYYEACRERLEDGGIFCQRIRQHDLDADSVETVLGTLAAVFAQVSVIQTEPGELCFLASDRERSVWRTDLLGRLQHPHVRHALAGIGMDWSEAASLPLIDSTDPVGIFSHRSLPPAASTAAAMPILTCATDAYSGRDKASEIADLFRPHQVRLSAAVQSPRHQEELKRRLSSLAQQLEILNGLPDRQLAYRNSLKHEMLRNPRPPQEQLQGATIVKTEHPSDRQRKQYLVRLGEAVQAARSGHLTESLASAVESSALPYEPLITEFVHHELVPLLASQNNTSGLQAREFRHRLRSVYFARAGDCSVRAVAGAIEQLVEEPEVCPDESDRFDLLNSLLQELVSRWESRREFHPYSATDVQQDVDRCITAASRAMDELEHLRDAVACSPEELRLRRRFLTRSLVTPLRSYREDIVAHRRKSGAEQPAAGPSDPAGIPLLAEPPAALTN